MSYGTHPSAELTRLFSAKPYQGADPSNAKILILGNDANYSPEISTYSFFQNIIEYHTDGVKFWEKTGVHHPFLLQEYPFDRRKGGVRYHQNFAKMGFGRKHASDFSFVELLNVPTIGNTGSDIQLFYDLLDSDHLDWLEQLILGSSKHFVLVNQTLVRSIGKISKRLGVLRKLNNALNAVNSPGDVVEMPNGIIYSGYSFSHSVTNEYLNGLRDLIHKHLEE